MSRERITIDQYGLDEIVLSNVDIHIERMSADAVWIGVYRVGETNAERRVSVFYEADGKTLRAVIAENEIGVEETPKV